MRTGLGSLQRDGRAEDEPGGQTLTPGVSQLSWSYRCHTGAAGPRGLRPCRALRGIGTEAQCQESTWKGAGYGAEIRAGKTRATWGQGAVADNGDLHLASDPVIGFELVPEAGALSIRHL